MGSLTIDLSADMVGEEPIAQNAYQTVRHLSNKSSYDSSISESKNSHVPVREKRFKSASCVPKLTNKVRVSKTQANNTEPSEDYFPGEEKHDKSSYLSVKQVPNIEPLTFNLHEIISHPKSVHSQSTTTLTQNKGDTAVVPTKNEELPYEDDPKEENDENASTTDNKDEANPADKEIFTASINTCKNFNYSQSAVSEAGKCKCPPNLEEGEVKKCGDFCRYVTPSEQRYLLK